MWCARYYNRRYFAARYWAKVGRAVEYGHVLVISTTSGHGDNTTVTTPDADTISRGGMQETMSGGEA